MAGLHAVAPSRAHAEDQQCNVTEPCSDDGTGGSGGYGGGGGGGGTGGDWGDQDGSGGTAKDQGAGGDASEPGASGDASYPDAGDGVDDRDGMWDEPPAVPETGPPESDPANPGQGSQSSGTQRTTVPSIWTWIETWVIGGPGGGAIEPDAISGADLHFDYTQPCAMERASMLRAPEGSAEELRATHAYNVCLLRLAPSPVIEGRVDPHGGAQLAGPGAAAAAQQATAAVRQLHAATAQARAATWAAMKAMERASRAAPTGHGRAPRKHRVSKPRG